MNTASILSRVTSAVMAAACSLCLLAAVGQQMNPSRLAANPHVVELERVVVTAPAAAAVAVVAARTVAN